MELPFRRGRGGALGAPPLVRLGRGTLQWISRAKGVGRDVTGSVSPWGNSVSQLFCSGQES